MVVFGLQTISPKFEARSTYVSFGNRVVSLAIMVNKPIISTYAVSSNLKSNTSHFSMTITNIVLW